MGYEHQDQHPPPFFQTQQNYQPYPNHIPPNYHYPYPQQPPPLAAYYYQQHYTHVTRDGGCYRCFCCCICSIIVIAIIISLIILINWLILRPQIPTFLVTYMESLLNPTAKPITALWTITITVDNTDKDAKVNLDDADSVLIYDDIKVGNSKVQPFSVEKGEKKKITVMVEYKEMAAVLESSLRYDMSNELMVRQSLKFKLGVHVKTELKEGKLTRRPAIKFYCKGLEVEFNSPIENIGGYIGNLPPGKEYDCKINPIVLAFGTD